MKQKHAKIYRESQLQIVETATAVCKFVLKSAIQKDKAIDILKQMQHDLPAAIAQNLQNLVNHYTTRLTRPFELLTLEAILEILPKGLTPALLRCISEVEANMSTQNDPSWPDKVALDKSRFAILLAALYSMLDQGVQLPYRAKSWLHQLSQWYPLDADSWAYVPSQEDEPPPALMSLLAARARMSPDIAADCSMKQWLRPDRVCWGWNVMEEQLVQVPTSVLQHHGSPAPPNDGPVTILLYWEQC